MGSICLRPSYGARILGINPGEYYVITVITGTVFLFLFGHRFSPGRAAGERAARDAFQPLNEFVVS